MSSLPESVQAQATLANELQKSVYAPEKESANTDDAEAQVKAQAEAQDEKQPKEQKLDNETSDPKDAEKSDIEKTQAEEKADESKEVPREETVEYWKQRVSVLEGKLKAEIPRLTDQVKAEKTKAAKLEVELHNAQVELKTLKKEFDESDLSEMLSRNQYKNVDDAVKESERDIELESLRAQIKAQEEAELADKTQRFFDAFEAKIPNWKEIHGSSAFQEWLEKSDPIYGVKRSDALANASDSFDVPRTVAIFEEWLGLTQQTNASKQSLKSELESEVVPGRTTASSATPSNQSKGFTQAEISQFYQDRSLGRIAPEEAARIEQQIFKAIESGNVR